MKKLVVVLHSTLDGFVAGSNGEMDWVKVDQELFDFGKRQTDKAGTALYGRVTYQMMEGYWPTAADRPGATKHDRDHSQWYKSVQKIVVSRTLHKEQTPGATIVGDNLATALREEKSSGDRNIIMYGSPSVFHSLLQEKLVDDLWLFVNPVLIGRGIPVFKNMTDRLSLRFVESHGFSSGVIALHYSFS